MLHAHFSHALPPLNRLVIADDRINILTTEFGTIGNIFCTSRWNSVLFPLQKEKKT